MPHDIGPSWWELRCRGRDVFLHNLWRDAAGLPELESGAVPTPEQIRETECNRHFIELMDNRMVMGYFRYGALSEQSGFDHLKYMRMKLESYADTGNLENLVDLANMARIEFTYSQHPSKHFQALDDQQHGKKEAPHA